MNRKENTKNVVPILSHILTDNQINDLKDNWQIKNIIELPYVLKSKWGNINPEGELDFELINEIKAFILDNTEIKDYIIVQGEFGMSFAIVSLCLKLNRIPIYATSRRSVKESKDSETIKTIRVFEHVQFRKYKLL